MHTFKKLIALLLCMVLALSFVACGGTDPVPTVDLGAIEETMEEGDKECVHAWGDWEDFEESTCVTEGVAIRECENCGKQESKRLPATGHDVSDGKCLDCGAKIKKCDHDDTEMVVVKAPTCTEKGKEHEICSVCKTILDENKLDALGHNGETVIVKEATCTEYGEKYEICTNCDNVLSQSDIYPKGHDWEYHSYQDPTCTEPGWYSYDVCLTCGYNDREEIPATGHEMVAGTCSECGYVDTTFEVLTAPGMVETSHTVTIPESVIYNAEAATVQVLTSTFTYDDQVIEYTLTPAVSGYYRIWFTEIYSGNVLDVYVLNALGEKVKYSTYIVNNEGITAELTGGETYTIQVKQRTGLFSYQLNVGFQKAVVDISGYDVINDSITYADEVVVYSFTPTVAGTYRLQFSNMMADLDVDIYVYNYLGERVNYSTYCNNGEGVTISNFEVGQTYTIRVQERSNLGTYTLNICKPTATTDVSSFNTVYDSIRYTDQVNVYTFTATTTNMSLFINGMESDKKVDLYLYNSLGATVDYETYCYNGDGFNVKNLTIGETYTIKIKYRGGPASYALRMYTGKAPVDVTSNMAVKDTMEYDGQINTYVLTVDEAGEHIIMMAAAGDYDCLSVAVYDASGNLINEDYYMYAGDYFSIGELAVGDQVTIQVTEYDTCSYTLSIQ